MMPDDRITVEQLVRIRVPRHELLIELTLEEANELFLGLQDVQRGILALRPLRLPMPARIPIVPTDEGLDRLAADLGVAIPVTEVGPSLQDDIERMVAEIGAQTGIQEVPHDVVPASGTVDDADEQEAEFLSRLPHDGNKRDPKFNAPCTLLPVEPSNTPEPPAEPEPPTETPAPSNDRQVTRPGPRPSEVPVADRVVEAWNYNKQTYPDRLDSWIVGKIAGLVARSSAEVRSILAERGIAVAPPMSLREAGKIGGRKRAEALSVSTPEQLEPPRAAPEPEPKPSIEDVNAPMPLAGVGPEATIQLIHALARSARRRWSDDEKSIRLHIDDLGPLTQLRKVSDAAIALFDSMNREWLDAYSDLPPFKQRDVDSALLAGWKKVAA